MKTWSVRVTNTQACPSCAANGRSWLAIPPAAERNIGVKEACSTSSILVARTLSSSFFHVSCILLLLLLLLLFPKAAIQCKSIIRKYSVTLNNARMFAAKCTHVLTHCVLAQQGLNNQSLHVYTI